MDWTLILLVIIVVGALVLLVLACDDGTHPGLW